MLSAYLRLLRFPAVFTAMADVLLGFLLVNQSFRPFFDFFLLLAASSCLYMAGMVFNDVFDRDKDAQFRPDRPIPSGQIPLRSAVVTGIGLLLAALVAAGAAGLGSLSVAGLLALMVLAYDGWLKRTPFGPAAMGACRFLNVLLGASVVQQAATIWSPPQLPVAAGLGIYVAGITWFARREAQSGRRLELSAAAVVLNLGLAVLAAFVLYWPGEEARVSVTLFVLGVVALTINRRLFAALVNPTPARVQTAVSLALLSLIVIDAILALFATGQPGYSFAIVALIVPAAVLARWIPVT